MFGIVGRDIGICGFAFCDFATPFVYTFIRMEEVLHWAVWRKERKAHEGMHWIGLESMTTISGHGRW
jgi:hypothetical protein